MYNYQFLFKNNLLKIIINKKMSEFDNILKKIINTNNNLLLHDLFECYNNNKLEIQSTFLANKNNIIYINDTDFNLSEIHINSLDSYKIIVSKYCDFIENFFSSNEEITEKNINNIIIDIIYYLNMKESIINYIINIPEHYNFFYNNGLHLYNENLILDNCIKRTNEPLYKILVKNLVYYKIKNDNL
jgi:hypothetical protein